MFRLTNAEVKPLTPQLAADFLVLEASPTEREIDPTRIKHLKEKAEAGHLVTFHWSVAQLGNRKLRMNGQHSSTMLCGLNGAFPQGLMVHLDEYQVDTPDGLALLFRQFDDRKSSRSSLDVSGAYQGLCETLRETPRKTAKRAVEGYCWYQRQVEGVAVPSGDNQYELFSTPALHGFIVWLGGILDSKTPELQRDTVVAAMYATFAKNEMEAKAFWAAVARGGPEFDDSAPATVLDVWLKTINENKKQKTELKPAQFYQGCIYAWNAFREERQLQRINADTRKGLWQPHE
jgi:hypothetical protein